MLLARKNFNYLIKTLFDLLNVPSVYFSCFFYFFVMEETVGLDSKKNDLTNLSERCYEMLYLTFYAFLSFGSRQMERATRCSLEKRSEIMNTTYFMLFQLPFFMVGIYQDRLISVR